MSSILLLLGLLVILSLTVRNGCSQCPSYIGNDMTNYPKNTLSSNLQTAGGTSSPISDEPIEKSQVNGCPRVLPFSYLGNDGKNGNPASWAGRVNPIVSRDKFTDTCNKPVYVYQGSPNPLLHQMKPMKVPKDTMFYFANAECSPECCGKGSPYSCSTGCVCAFPKNIHPCPTQMPYDNWISGPNSWQ